MSVRVRDLLALAQRDLEINGRPYAAVFPSQTRRLLERLGDVGAAELGFGDLERYKLERVQEGAARDTVNKELGALAKGFRIAAEAQLIQAVVVPRIRRLRPGEPRSGFLTVPEFGLLAAELHGDVRDVCEWAYWSGWRRGECFGLEWEATSAEWVWCRDKNGTTKQAPLSGPLGPVLARRRGLRRPDCPWVFHRQGKPIRDLRKAWKAACLRAGVGDRVFHDMRRSFVRNAIRAGIDRDTVMALSGHRTHAVFSRYNIQDEEDILAAGRRLKMAQSGRRPGRRRPG